MTIKGRRLLLIIATTALSFSTSFSKTSAIIEPESLGVFKKTKKETVKDSTVVSSDYKGIVSEKNLVTKGLFSIYKKGEDFFFDVPTNMLNKDMLVVNRLQRVPAELNDAGVNKGVNYHNQMISFEIDKGSKQLLVRQKRPLPYSPQADAITQSVKDNFISPLIEGLKIESYSSDSASVVVKVNNIYDGSETSINNVFSDINLGTSAIKKLSRILSVTSTDNSISATSELTTRVSEGMSTVNVTVVVSSSILLLPEKPMMGRLDNPRVGYFTNSLLSFSDTQQQVKTTDYITRWRLEPKEEDVEAYLKGELVEPSKPIVFYIDESTPFQWRKYLKQGIEDWQVAFEKAGFKNAIQAKDLTDSIAALGDVNSSVLTYAASKKVNAMGPSLLDPRTGEILEADIMWWHNVISMVKEWIVVQTGPYTPAVQTTNLPEDIMGDAIRFVACHEVGHSLGLRHNMIASAAFSTDSLRSKTFTDKMKTTSSSIMDYARYNYIAQPGDGVTKSSPNIGAYDIFAIEYGYRWYASKSADDEKDLLFDFLAKHTGPLYRYSEAQDPRDAVDPRAQNEDLGDDAILSSQLGIANLKRIVPHILDWTTTGERGQTYAEASSLHYAVINQWNNYLYHVLANIGGLYIENTVVGDGQKTFTFVEKQRQKAATQFLLDEVLCYPKWLFDIDLSDYTYLRKDTPLGVVENSPNKILKNAQAYILWDLLSNNRLMRMLENESKNGRNAYTAVDLMDDLHKSIFAVTERNGIPDVTTRNLQKGFVDALITAAAESEGVKINKKIQTQHFLLDANKSFCSHQECLAGDRNGGSRTIDFYGLQINRISDAISVKRGELLRIKKLLSLRSSTTDIATKYHYDDLVLRINTALGIK